MYDLLNGPSVWTVWDMKSIGLDICHHISKDLYKLGYLIYEMYALLQSRIDNGLERTDRKSYVIQFLIEPPLQNGVM